MKKVVIVGVFTPGSSNNGIARAFEQLGWEVKRVPYRELAQTVGFDSACWGIVSCAEAFKPDLMLFCKFNQFPPDVITECGKFANKTCLWFMDSWDIAKEQCPEVISHCKRASFSIHWPGVADEFTKAGVENCFGLVEGCDESEFKPTEPVDKYKTDISFIGSKNHREEYVQALRDAGFEVRCYGNGYDQYVTGDDFNAVCSSSKAVLNIPTYVGAREYYGDRIVRTLATKTLSLTHYVPGMENHFNNYEHLVWFEGPEQCVEVAKKCIDNKEIAEQGYKLFLEKYTCVEFVKSLLFVSGIEEKKPKEGDDQ